MDDEKRLSYLFVDLGGVGITASELLRRVALRTKKFSEKGPGWKRLLSDGRFSVTILSPFRRADLVLAARHVAPRLALTVHEVECLRAAVGLRDSELHPSQHSLIKEASRA